LQFFYCNSFEVNHDKTIFSLILKFKAPDGNIEAVYVTISPSGAKTLAKVLEERVKEFEEKFGEVQPWNVEKQEACAQNCATYVQ